MPEISMAPVRSASQDSGDGFTALTTKARRHGEDENRFPALLFVRFVVAAAIALCGFPDARQ
jgi:hypothetical protein